MTEQAGTARRRRKVAIGAGEGVGATGYVQDATYPGVTGGDVSTVSPRGDTDPYLAGIDAKRGNPAKEERFPFPSPWGAIVTDVFKLDVQETYARLSQELTLGDGATEYGTVLAAVDKAAKNAFTAACLVRAAKLADDHFSFELSKRTEVLRTAARDELEREKADGKRSKAPTIQDIEDRTVANWPDEMAAISRRRGEMHGAFRSIEALEKAWWTRCSDLRAIAERFAFTGRG